jgi:hypothetical protein
MKNLSSLCNEYIHGKWSGEIGKQLGAGEEGGLVGTDIGEKAECDDNCSRRRLGRSSLGYLQTGFPGSTVHYRKGARMRMEKST